MTIKCAICGVNNATTKDHIPPKGIYPKPTGNEINYNTVPACAKCNNGGSISDEEFKVFMGIATGQFRENPNLVVDSIAKTIGKNQRIANQIFRTAKHTHAYLRGPVLEPVVSIEFDGEKYRNVICRIVRGLYWMEKKESITPNQEIIIIPTQSMENPFFSLMRELMPNLDPHQLNNDTFIYKFTFLDDGASIWGMQFFKKHTVFGYVGAL